MQDKKTERISGLTEGFALNHSDRSILRVMDVVYEVCQVAGVGVHILKSAVAMGGFGADIEIFLL